MYNALTNDNNVLSQATIKISDYSLLNSALESINNLNNSEIKNDYNLPINLNGVTVTWSGENVVNNVLKYIAPQQNTKETLTAVLTLGEL